MSEPSQTLPVAPPPTLLQKVRAIANKGGRFEDVVEELFPDQPTANISILKTKSPSTFGLDAIEV